MEMMHSEDEGLVEERKGKEWKITTTIDVKRKSTSMLEHWNEYVLNKIRINVIRWLTRTVLLRPLCNRDLVPQFLLHLQAVSHRL